MKTAKRKMTALKAMQYLLMFVLVTIILLDIFKVSPMNSSTVTLLICSLASLIAVSESQKKKD